MKIGMRGHDFGPRSVAELVNLYSQYGVQTVQLAIPKAVSGVDSYFQVDDALLADIRERLGAAGIDVSVLGCYIEPAMEDDAERRSQVEVFKRGIACAEALEAGCVGTETTRYSGDEAGRLQAFDRLCTSLDMMLKEAQAHKVTVAVEPVASHTLNTPALVAKLRERFEGSGLAFIFDPVNLLVPEGIDGQQRLWRECLQVFGDRVAAMHLKDARLEGAGMVSCPLGEGVLRLSAEIVPWVRANRPGMPLLREETSIETVAGDFAWIRETFMPE